jgi:hypothetical protein
MFSSSAGPKQTLMLRVAYVAAICIVVVTCVNILLSPIGGDGTIFLAVGRGILNGLAPYQDLFETKPPGIFLLSALALRLGGVVAAQLLTIAALAGIVISGWAISKSAGFLLGVLMALLTAVEAGGFFPEAFGAAALCVYVAVVSHKSSRWPSIATATAALSLAVLFKEPMLLSAAAIAVVMLQDRRAFMMLYVIPQVLALVAFVAVLFFTGLLSYYVAIYLPFMIEVRVGAAENSGIGQFVGDLLRFSPPFLALLAYSFMSETSAVGRMRWCFGLAIAVAASLMGGYEPHHAAAAIPVFMALLTRIRNRRYALPLIVCSIAAMPFMGNVPISGRFSYPTLESDQQVAEALDAIMDRCRETRYEYLGSPSAVYGYTRHSPLGPLFFLNNYTLRNGKAVDQTLHNLQQANLILFERKTSALSIEKEFYDLTADEVASQFQSKPWECAGGTISTSQFVLLYRTARR